MKTTHWTRRSCRMVTAFGGTACTRPAHVHFGDLDYCGTHWEELLSEITGVLVRARSQNPHERDLQQRALSAMEAGGAAQAAFLRADRQVDYTAGQVYYAYRDGHIKIGWTTRSVRERLRVISSGGCKMPPSMTQGPVTLLATEVGGHGVERDRHEQFAPWRVAGEWFLDVPPLRAHIATLTEEVIRGETA